jgi:hypothetical protein
MGYKVSNGRMTVNDELGSMWKEAAMTYLKGLRITMEQPQ